MRLSLQDGDGDFLASFRHKRDKQGVEHRNVHLVVQDNYDDYDVLTTDYDKKMMLTHDYVSMFIHIPRSTILVTVEGDVQVDYGRRTGYLSRANWVAYVWLFPAFNGGGPICVYVCALYIIII